MRTALLLTLLLSTSVAAQERRELFHRRPESTPRWITFENPNGLAGAGGRENRGAKGHPAEPLAPGETKTLLDLTGPGIIRHIWVTLSERDPVTLRSLRLDMYWDGSKKPAVSVPFGDFFGAVLGRVSTFENEYFVDPEGRSFNTYLPMPFKSGARVTITNEGARGLTAIYYQIEVEALDKPDPKALYLNAYWHRDPRTQLGEDFEILPLVRGEGRYLGVHYGVIGPEDTSGWWGEGEAKIYLDGDTDWPTLVGTGSEDYIGTGWGQGLFHNRFQGSLVNDKENRQWGFYRYHTPDPIYFKREIRVTMQQMGGDLKKGVLAMLEKGVEIKPVTVASEGRFVKFLERPDPVDLATDDSPEDGWVNFYRRDDVSAVAFFYFDKPSSDLPTLQPVTVRVAGLGGRPEGTR